MCMQKRGELSVVNQFFTVEDKSIEREIVEKKSRFIAKIMKVNSEQEANEKIAEVKKTIARIKTIIHERELEDSAI